MTRVKLNDECSNDLTRRVCEHKAGKIPGFTQKYNVTKLVYYETCSDIKEAIAREKQIKGLVRRRKDALVETLNPAWADLADARRAADPSLRSG